MCFLPPGSLVIMELHVILLLQVCLACESFVHRHSVGAAAPSLDARPSTLKYSGDNVTIAWKDIDSPSKDDWLGIYSPPTSANDQYIGFIILSTCPTWSRGAGSMKIPLVNMRGPYNFRIFRGISVTLNATSSRNVNRSNNRSTTTALDKEGNPLPDVSTLLAISQDIHFSNYNEPTQIHLALTSNETAVRVMFVTKDPVRSKVRFGSGEDNLETTVEANFVTYSQIDMCDEPASSVGWRDPGYIHDAVMEGLIYGGRYYYQARSNVGGWSTTYTFISPNPRNEETNALLFGDMGTSVPYSTYHYTQSESKNTLKWLKRDLEEIGARPSIIAHIGDISYARGYSWLWDSFFTQIQPIAATAPYHVCMGNHDYDWPGQPFKPSWSSYGTDSGGECGVPYSMRFIMPGSSSSSTGSSPDIKNLYYSINVGVVHFLFYSTETNFLPGSDQYAFIANDLRTVDRIKTPFVVLLGHRPLYTTDYRAFLDITTQKLVQTFEPLLIETKVTVAFCGHVHKYERMCPLQNSTCMNPSKAHGELPVYMVIGMGGHSHQPIDIPMEGHPEASRFPQPGWSTFRTFEWGYVRLRATKNFMTVSYVGNHDGKVHDRIEIPSPEEIKAGSYVEPQQSIFDTAFKEPLPCGRTGSTLSFLFVYALGCGLGVGGAVFKVRREQMKQWQLLGYAEGTSTSDSRL
ncbi:probable inactive purple acid phosphatase 2 isoform X2 [Physcomitrium patens]|uniref:probable inactive purple acid phosphatase 2 isoform X2 n=1 Tax=Physcomitrium patens TaxID=3218 RepID=UPI003CCDE44B